MNNITLTGRITKDLELKQIGQTYKCDFTLAVDRRFAKEGQQKTDFINVTCFGKTAENLVNYQSKGSKIGVNGTLNIDQYKDNEGNNKTFTKVIANEIEFLESKNNSSSGNFMMIDDAEDYIPF